MIIWRIDAPNELRKLAAMIAHLKPAGAPWFVTPKGRTSTLPERMLRAAFLGAGLADIKDLRVLLDAHRNEMRDPACGASKKKEGMKP